jgi:hypothetical protein
LVPVIRQKLPEWKWNVIVMSSFQKMLKAFEHNEQNKWLLCFC